MKIAVAGTGYVGLSMAILLAQHNTVKAVDIIPEKVDMIACEVCGKEIDRTQYELSREELEKLYELSKSHDLAHIVGNSLIKNGLVSDPELKAGFKKQIMTAVYRYEKLQYELTRLKDVLNEAKIPFIPLKGSVIRKFYPEPWLRTSCDIDVLVKEKDIERASEFPLKMNIDDRGSFTELLKTQNCGQFSVNISKPGITKGQHWHNSKWEFFMVVSGHGLIQERKIGTEEVIEFEVDGDHIQAVHMLPGYTHNIINLSDTENLVTVMWANEQFDPSHPDTFGENV